jgi:hypothetical protein
VDTKPKAYRSKNATLFLPGTMIFASMIQAGTFIKNGKSKMSTLKSSLVPAMISMDSNECEFVNPQTAEVMTDFEVDSRSVVIPSTGGRIMAHRPRLDEWRLDFMLSFDENEIGESMVRELVDIAGKKCGLGDYRPQKRDGMALCGQVRYSKVKRCTVRYCKVSGSRNGSTMVRFRGRLSPKGGQVV